MGDAISKGRDTLLTVVYNQVLNVAYQDAATSFSVRAIVLLRQ